MVQISARRRAVQQVSVEKCSNAGLVFDRWYTAAEYREGENSQNARVVRALADFKTDPFYRRRFEALKDALSAHKTEETGSTVFQQFKVDTRLIVNAGDSHITEVGLAFHHTFGVPYIPGSAIKGLARRYCRTVFGPKTGDNQSEPDKEDSNREQFADNGEVLTALFGPADPGSAGPDEGTGAIIFHDALYVPGTALDDKPVRIDVLTPHHSGYSQNGESPPSDTDSPIPVQFLSVGNNAEFLFAIETLPGLEDWATWLLKNVLTKALQELGIGAKTAAGYGRMTAASASPEFFPKPAFEENAKQCIELFTDLRKLKGNEFLNALLENEETIKSSLSQSFGTEQEAVKRSVSRLRGRLSDLLKKRKDKLIKAGTYDQLAELQKAMKI